MSKIYLAGPITGESYERATKWRKTAYNFFVSYDIDCFSPMRDKRYLQGSKEIPAQNHGFMSGSREIMIRDFTDCTTADLLLVNLLGTKAYSVGTCMELGWAYYLRIPTVVIVEPDNIHLKHPMVKETVDCLAQDLSEGLGKALSLLRSHS